MLPKFLYDLRLRMKMLLARQRGTEEIFTSVYKNNKWGKSPDGKYFSGSGSLIHEGTEKYIEVLSEFIKTNDVKEVFEIGCGDFRIMSNLLSKVDVQYTGSDIAKPVVDYNNEHFGSEKISFIHLNAIEAPEFPKADLCIIRQVLQHLSNEQIQEILSKTDDFKYVIVTEGIPLDPDEKNLDKAPGVRIRLQEPRTSGVFLDAPPFSLTTEDLMEYPVDVRVLGKKIPACIRTVLIRN